MKKLSYKIYNNKNSFFFSKQSKNLFHLPMLIFFLQPTTRVEKTSRVSKSMALFGVAQDFRFTSV